MDVAHTACASGRARSVLELFTKDRRLTAQLFEFRCILGRQTAAGGRPKDFRGFRTLGLTHVALLSHTGNWCSNNFKATGDSDIVCGVEIRHTSTTVNLARSVGRTEGQP
ncbi:hypothetical protein MYVA_3374 [Mycolicibacterium vaccae 95051]|nr:hypothetical protein MYVA_3374 [Mycolicibacterium vaccae 95051]